ncbi:MAG: winged helix-turn-helix transcriptional regulator [Halobacteriota archaeon]
MRDLECEYDLAALVLGQNLIDGKWAIPILWILSKGTKRFSELHSFFRRTSRSVFTKQLHQLEHSNLIQREVYGEVPVRVEYSLTEMGVKLIPVLSALVKWSQDYIECQKGDGVTDIDYVKTSPALDKYKAYQDTPIIKEIKPPEDPASKR